MERKRWCKTCGKKYECERVQKKSLICGEWERRSYREVLKECGKAGIEKKKLDKLINV